MERVRSSANRFATYEVGSAASAGNRHGLVHDESGDLRHPKRLYLAPFARQCTRTSAIGAWRTSRNTVAVPLMVATPSAAKVAAPRVLPMSHCSSGAARASMRAWLAVMPNCRAFSSVASMWSSGR